MTGYRDVPLVLRHSAVIRAGFATAAVLASSFLLLAFVTADAVGLALTGVMAVAVLATAYAAFRERVVLRRGELVVVNAWRTHRLVPADVIGFSFHDRPISHAPTTTWAHLRDGGRVRLWALGWQPSRLRLLEAWRIEQSYWQPMW